MIPERPPLYQVTSQVTYLDMHAPPADPLPPVPKGLGSVEQAAGLTLDYYRFLYNSVGADWDWHDRRYLDDDTLAALVLRPEIEVHVAMVDGVPGGYVEFNRGEADTVEIAYFGLLPAAIGRGIGRYFLRWAIDKAWSFGPSRVWLNTCDLDHPQALSNYQRAGFQIFDVITEERQTADKTKAPPAG